MGLHHTADSWHTGCAWLVVDHEVDLGTCSITVGSRNNAGRDSLHGQIDSGWGASAFRGGRERHSWETMLAIGAVSIGRIHTIHESCNL